MTSPPATAAPAPTPPLRRAIDWLAGLDRGGWVLLAGFVIIAIPTLVELGRQVWTMDIGAHGPIVLATGVWLLAQSLPRLRALQRPSSDIVTATGVMIALPLYVFGRAYDFISLEAAGVYLLLLTIAYRLFGWAAMKAEFFAFLYVGFLVPPPGWFINQLTVPLRAFVSAVSTNGLALLGYPISREGVAIYIAQYQLLVEDACSGMNSIVGLSAITLFYIYLLHRASWRYALVLAAMILPIAVVANIIRVCVLILLTYYAGDEVAQGLLHDTAGIMLFVLALALTFAADIVLQRLLPAHWRSERG